MVATAALLLQDANILGHSTEAKSLTLDSALLNTLTNIKSVFRWGRTTVNSLN